MCGLAFLVDVPGILKKKSAGGAGGSATQECGFGSHDELRAFPTRLTQEHLCLLCLFVAELRRTLPFLWLAVFQFLEFS